MLHRISFKLALFLLVLSVLACGIPTSTGSPATKLQRNGITNVYIPQTMEAVEFIHTIVTAEKGVHIRSGAGEQYKHISYLFSGDEVTVYNCEKSIDGGTWANIGVGYVNARFLKDACPK